MDCVEDVVENVVKDVEDKYNESISLLAKNRSNTIFENKGNNNASVVLGNILKNSKEEVFIISTAFNEDYVENNVYKHELFNFIDKRCGKLNLLLEEIPEEIKASSALAMIYKLMMWYPKEIHILKMPTSFMINSEKVNLTVGDARMFRYEFDLELKKAICCFNNKIVSQDLIKYFKSICKFSEPVTDINILEC